jgi:hypothetical protein
LSLPCRWPRRSAVRHALVVKARSVEHYRYEDRRRHPGHGNDVFVAAVATSIYEIITVTFDYWHVAEEVGNR